MHDLHVLVMMAVISRTVVGVKVSIGESKQLVSRGGVMRCLTVCKPMRISTTLLL